MRRRATRTSLLRVAAAIALASTACGGDGAARATGVASSPAPTTTAIVVTATSTSTTTTVATTTTAVATTTTTAPPDTEPDTFTASIARVTAADLGASWHEGCPVDPADLRMVTVTLVGFDDADQTGRVVVHAAVADEVVEAFHRLHRARFPVRKMKPIFTQEEYDDFETPDDNSTGFSCRNAVNDSGSPSWSQHAYGKAIDINPIENPYIEGDRVIPSAGAAYTDRSDVRPGMAEPGNALVKAFAAIGWGWGAGFEDYQHFSTNGR